SVQKAYQKFDKYVVARSNGSDVKSVDYARNVLPTEDRGMFKATMLQGAQSCCFWESQQSTAGRVPSPLATRDRVLTGRRRYSGDVERHPIKDMCKNVPCLECGQLGHEIFSCPRLWNMPGDVVTGQKSLSASPDFCANLFSVTSGNSEEVPVVPAGGAKESEVAAAVSSHGHQGELVSKSAIKDRQRTQMKPELPATDYGKTVAVCGTDPSEVGVYPAGRSAEVVKMDLLQFATPSSGETQVEAQPAARLRTQKDWTLYVPGVIHQSAGSGNLGVTNTVCVPGSLVTGATEMPRETSQEPAVVRHMVSQDNCGAALVGKRMPLERKGGVLSVTRGAVCSDQKQPVKAYNTAMSMADDTCTYCDVFKSNDDVEKCITDNVDGLVSPMVTTGSAAELSQEISGGLPVLEPAGLQDSSDTAQVENNGKIAQMREYVLSQSDVVDSDWCRLSAAKPLCPPVSPWAEGAVLQSADDWSTDRIDWDSLAIKVEVSLSVSASQALANEPLHVVSKGKVPRVLCLDVACLEITEMLLELVKIFPLYTCMYPPQMGDLVLRSTNQWRHVVQAMLSNVDKNWVLQCWLLLQKVVSQFSARMLPATVMCGRRSGELLKESEMIDIVEVSPYAGVMRCIPAGAIRGAAEQWLVHGACAVSPARPREREGPGKDAAVVGIQSITRREVQFEVPGDTLTGNGSVGNCNEKVYEKHCRALSDNSEVLVEVPMDTEMVKEIGVEKCGAKCVLVGQSLLECWTTGSDVKLRECPIGSNCLPVDGPSLDPVLANQVTRGLDDDDNIELNNPLWNIAIEVKQKYVVLISDDLVAKGNHTGVSEPDKQMLLVSVASGSERGQSLTDFMEMGPQQSQESRSVGGKRRIPWPEGGRDREISGSPWF
ncbi:hypothetical protein AB205_0030470, partial [Aquarana catesbeiana]